LGLIAALYLEMALHECAKHKQSLNSIESLLLYLGKGIAGKFSLEEKHLSEYIGVDKLDDMRQVKPSTSVKNTSICRIFIRKPIESSIISGQKKGFVIPFAYWGSSFSRRAFSPRLMSMIFVDDTPEEISNYGKYFLFHEIGHTTDAAWRIKCRPFLAVMLVSGMLIWAGCLNAGKLTILSFSIYAYVAVRLFFDLNHFTNELDDEITADTFAITRLPEYAFNSVGCRVSLEEVIERNLLNREIDKEKLTNLFDFPAFILAEYAAHIPKILGEEDDIKKSKFRKGRSTKQGVGEWMRFTKDMDQFNKIRRLMYIKSSMRLRKIVKKISEKVNDEDILSYYSSMLSGLYYERRESRWFFRILEAVLLIPVMLSTTPVSWLSVSVIGIVILVLWFIWLPSMIYKIALKTHLVEIWIKQSLVNAERSAV
jgi:hypothetical protein